MSLQLASGAFLLNQAFCEAIRVPMEKLKWTSPFTCHRVSLTARQPPSPQPCTSPAPLHPSCDGLSQEPLAEGRPGQEPRAVVEHMGKLWATVVALAWLEHSSASYFVEWELVAAKASSWLDQVFIEHYKGFPGGSDGKESACNAGDPGLILGSGRSPGGGNGYLLQYSCLENSMDRGTW